MKLKAVFVLFISCLLLAAPAGAAQNAFNLRTSGPAYAGPTLIGDINTALQALATNNAGGSPPSSVYPEMWWINTATNPFYVEMWDGAAWVIIGSINTSSHAFTPNGATNPSLAFSGLNVSYASATSISLTASSITVTTGTAYQSVSVSSTINCTTSGVANGLDGQTYTSLQASTWYYIFAIYNPSTQTASGLASISSTSPTLPSGYTYKRLCGVARTNSSSQFVVARQHGNHFIYDEYQLVASANTAESWLTINCGSFIPPVSTRGYFQYYMSTGNPVTALIRSNGSASATGHFLGYATSSAPVACVNDWVDTDNAQSVQINVSAAPGGGWFLRVLGFELNL